jgi:drug/metabolite transporter (DMT)-like permease
MLTILTMIAFAANSLLNRAALAGDHIGPGEFAALRVISGAGMLWLLVAVRSGAGAILRPPDWTGIGGLVGYLLGFSFAYMQLDAGLGALVLFAGVQITMFAGALLEGERPPLLRWMGMVVSLGGLTYLAWPGSVVQVSLPAFGLMASASLGWGAYSLVGRRVTNPLVATASNFVYASPVVIAVAYMVGAGGAVSVTGVGLAILSGALTSGLGYALWYRVLPQVGATKGALAQLSVPVIARLGGVVFLAEPVTSRAAIASGLVLGGIACGVLSKRRPRKDGA